VNYKHVSLQLGEKPYTHSMAEFFVMRKYRRGGVGQRAAVELFDRFPGVWSVKQVQSNLPSHSFWRNVIGRYTDGNYEEIREAGWDGPVQTFISGGGAADGSHTAKD
jgi:predicted acetyltransferase